MVLILTFLEIKNGRTTEANHEQQLSTDDGKTVRVAAGPEQTAGVQVERLRENPKTSENRRGCEMGPSNHFRVDFNGLSRPGDI